MDLSSFQRLKQHSGSIILADQFQRRRLNVALDRLAFVDQQKSWAPPNTQTWDQYLRLYYKGYNNWQTRLIGEKGLVGAYRGNIVKMLFL